MPAIPAPSEDRGTTDGPDRTDVLVVGGGIAGLTTAFLLGRRGRSVRVLEAESGVGGAIRTHRVGGFLVECGPNTVLATHPEVGELIAAAGLSAERIEASPVAKKRFIVRRGKPVPLPTSPFAFLRTPLFSPRAKLRLLAEPFIRRGNGTPGETVAHFVRRRLGREFLDYAIDPFVSGVYAGLPEELGVGEAFPRLVEVEARYGSLIKGQLLGARERRRRADRPRTEAGMFTFTDGLDRLPRAIAGHLGGTVLTGARVTEVASTGAGWQVEAVVDGSPRTFGARAVVLASGLRDSVWWSALGADTELFAGVPHPPLTVLALGFRRSDVGHPLDGFGMLVPRVEGRSILGALFPSTLFPGRAPSGHVLLTAFAGGARQPEIAGLPADELRARVLADLSDLLALSGEPVFSHRVHWPASIPQYGPGYGRVRAELDRLEGAHPGLRFTGNFRSGISVADTIRHAFGTASRIDDFLAEPATWAAHEPHVLEER